MRIISEKKKNLIGKILAANYFIASRSIGEKDDKVLFEYMSKIIENTCDLAFEIGGEKFATVEVPMYVYQLQHREKREMND